ncbi:TolC family protein [Thermus filiformis]|uniref:TolC family protein n=1 Tax=Thermus filiformis TaxID=276 RepID=UPI0009E48333|nr:TolC family protein [Thermus filiformis]
MRKPLWRLLLTVFPAGSAWALLAGSPLPALAQGADLRAWVRESPAYQEVALQKEAARRSLESAQAALLPSLSPQAAYSRPLVGQESLSLGVGGSLALLPWGPARNALDAAQRSYRQALLQARSQENALFQTALSQYLGVYLARLDLELAQKRLALREAQLQAVRDQREKGQATFQAVLEAESALSEAQAALFQAELALTLAEARLEATLGRKMEVSPLPLPEALPGLEEALAALPRRPDVLRARLALEEAEALLAQAERDRLLPQLTLSLQAQEGGWGASLGLNLTQGTLSYAAQYALLGGGVSGTSFQAQAAFPLLAPSQEATLALRAQGVEQARLALKNAEASALLDLRSKHQALLQAKAQVEVAEKALRASENSLEVAQKRLQAGTGTRLEVMQAELGLLQARRTLEGAKAAFLQAYYALRDAMGEALLGGEE